MTELFFTIKAWEEIIGLIILGLCVLFYIIIVMYSRVIAKLNKRRVQKYRKERDEN